MRRSIGLILACALLPFSPAPAADWGDLKMRFVYDDEPPQPRLIDQNFIGPLIDESICINEQDRGIKNVCVWLFPTDVEPLPVHADFCKSAADKVAMTISGGKVTPRIAVVRTSQTLVIANAEAFGYNIKVDFFSSLPFNELLTGGSSFERRFESAERTPAALSCTIHPWLQGYIFIRDDPYADLSDEHGRLSLKNLPAGNWTFALWHERVGFIKQTLRDGNTIELHRGRLTLEIQPGDNNLGEIKLSHEQFKP